MGLIENFEEQLREGYSSPQSTVLRVSLFYLAVTVLLTWPILSQPDNVYLTAPNGYHFIQDPEQLYLGHQTEGREYIDHIQHMDEVDTASSRLLNGELPDLVQVGYTVPPTYILTGAVLTLLTPLSGIVFHNLFFIGSMFLAGLFTFLLVREVLEDPEVALLAGCIYMSSFYLFNEYLLGHTNQWQIQWIPLVLFGVERIRSRADIGSVGGSTVALLGIAFALQALSSEQYTVYLTFMLPLYILLRSEYGAEGFRRRLFWKRVVPAAVLGLFLASPYIVARLSMAGTEATPVHSLDVVAYSWYVIYNVAGVFFAANARPQYLFRLSLLLLGILTLVTVPRERYRQLIPFAFLFGIGVVMAWGPFSPVAPYALLHQFWPFIEFFRVPYRMLPFALLGSSTLSAAVLFHVSDPGNSWTRRGIIVIGFLVGIQIFLVHYLLQFTSLSL